MTATWVTIGIYIALLVAIGIFTGRSSKSVADITVGGRKMGAWLSALSYGTAYFSAVMFVGYAGSTGYGFGLWGIIAGLGNMVFGTLLAWLLLARRTRKAAAEMGLHTMPEFLEKRYGSRAMRLFACIVVFIFLIPYSASVYKGLGSIARVLLGIDDTVFMIIIAVLGALLLLFGGYLVQARADFVQGIIMMAGVALLLFFVVRSQAVGGLAGLAAYAKTAEGLPSLNGKQWWALVSLVLMTSFGTWGLPHMIQKYFAIKSDEQARRGIWISTLFSLLVAGGGYFIGSLCHLFFRPGDYEKLSDAFGATFKDYIVPTMLKLANIPSILLGIVIVLLLAASVSTLCSVTLTAAATLVKDFFATLVPRTKEKSLSWGIKIVCVVFVIVSYFVANSHTPILDLMSYSWGILSGSFLAPYALSLYYKGANKTGAWAGIATGFCIALVPAVSKLMNVFGSTSARVAALMGYGPQYAVVAMASSVAVCFLVSAIAGKAKRRQTA
ncbi:MAG: sodium:solute symporter family protein [Oscillospiraceae bacterium]|nr:sodium:solute symporter family protein [Oscillospiraceae bacterium]